MQGHRVDREERVRRKSMKGQGRWEHGVPLPSPQGVSEAGEDSWALLTSCGFSACAKGLGTRKSREECV